ncbi:MAG: SRPBCC domain-containing protein [Candidatus Dormiibacterota bacterium]
MTRTFVAEKTVSIHAPAGAVWQALTDPEKVRQYMHGTTIATDWKIGSPITWSGEWKGKSYQDKGVVLAFDPEEVLSTTYWSSMSGKEDKPENYYTVTYRLDGDGETTTLTLEQDGNESQEAADQMAQNNWGPVLESLKEVAER